MLEKTLELYKEGGNILTGQQQGRNSAPYFLTKSCKKHAQKKLAHSNWIIKACYCGKLNMRACVESEDLTSTGSGNQTCDPLRRLVRNFYEDGQSTTYENQLTEFKALYLCHLKTCSCLLHEHNNNTDPRDTRRQATHNTWETEKKKKPHM